VARLWIAVIVRRDPEDSIQQIPECRFFRTVAVMGVMQRQSCELAGKLEGNITGAILSGIVGYVLDSGRNGRASTGVNRTRLNLVESGAGLPARNLGISMNILITVCSRPSISSLMVSALVGVIAYLPECPSLYLPHAKRSVAGRIWERLRKA